MPVEQHTHPFLERFLERWTEEFSRAVETHMNQRPEVAHARVERPEQWEQNAASLLWWKQEADSAGFGIWIGAEEPCWSALGGAPEEGGEAKQAYFGLLKQANQSLAVTAGAGFSRPLRWREGMVEEAQPALETLELLEVRITLAGKALPPMLVGVERAAQILEASSVALREADAARQPAVGSASPMLSRLMDLQLPVTVLLGRAVLPIRDVLKIASGSLIELDRQIDDYVEVRVHGTVVARGEIVSVRGNYGVRIKEIISRQDRIALQDAA
jgi:flagellar motor switch protein FliN/FliY